MLCRAALCAGLGCSLSSPVQLTVCSILHWNWPPPIAVVPVVVLVLVTWSASTDAAAAVVALTNSTLFLWVNGTKRNANVCLRIRSVFYFFFSLGVCRLLKSCACINQIHMCVGENVLDCVRWCQLTQDLNGFPIWKGLWLQTDSIGKCSWRRNRMFSFQEMGRMTRITCLSKGGCSFIGKYVKSDFNYMYLNLW